MLTHLLLLFAVIIVPVNAQVAQWAEWGAWEACSVSCGIGVRQRKSVCRIDGTGAVVNSNLCAAVPLEKWGFCVLLNCPSEYEEYCPAPQSRYSRYCTIGGYCDAGECHCGYYYVGKGEFCCVPYYYHICTVTADPHLCAFDNAIAGLHWPCRYRLTHFKSPLEIFGGGSCSVYVYGVNWLTDSGKYFTRAVEVNLATYDNFGNTMNGDFAKFDIDLNGFSADLEGSYSQFGDSHQLQWGDLEINCYLYSTYALFWVPQCDFLIKFRPHNPADDPGPQRRVPGIAIVTGYYTEFLYSPEQSAYGRFEESLCGVNNDTDDLYKDYKQKLGLKNDDQALLYAALSQTGFEQETLVADIDELIPDPLQCTRSKNVFASCSHVDKRLAIRACFPLLKKRRFLKCMLPVHKEQVLEVFNYCVEAVCNPCDPAAYAVMKGIITAAGCTVPSRTQKRLDRYCPGVFI